jgi:hypothetical protein
MSKHVLIIATHYDPASHYSYKWAEALRDDLLTGSSCGSCLLLDGENLCRSGTLLADVIERMDHIVFYGHGETDQWIGLPLGRASATIPLVDVGSVQDLDGRQVYAACCKSLATLGQNFATTFANNNPVPNFIGYQTSFDFSTENEAEFCKIVNDSIRTFILSSTPAATIARNQKAAWDQLSQDFSPPSGSKHTRPDAIFAASAAHNNSLSIGHV